MAGMREGRNGGQIKRREKGDPPNKGAGRPQGSRSFKTLLNEALAKMTTSESGEPIDIKQASVAEIVAMLTSDKISGELRLKAFQVVRDTIGEAPPSRSEITGRDGDKIQIETNIDRLSSGEAETLLGLMEKARGE